MNERIKDLALQANIKLDYFGYGVDIDDGNPNVAKFAELIINDVLGCYAAIDNGNRVEGTEDFIKAVIKRYGIGKKK